MDGVLVDGTATVAGEAGLGVGLDESVELSDLRLSFLRAVPVEAIEVRGDVLGVKKTSISESDSSSLWGTYRYPGCTHKYIRYWTRKETVNKYRPLPLLVPRHWAASQPPPQRCEAFPVLWNSTPFGVHRGLSKFVMGGLAGSAQGSASSWDTVSEPGRRWLDNEGNTVHNGITIFGFFLFR